MCCRKFIEKIEKKKTLLRVICVFVDAPGCGGKHTTVPRTREVSTLYLIRTMIHTFFYYVVPCSMRAPLKGHVSVIC